MLRRLFPGLCLAIALPATICAQSPRGGPRPWWDRQLTRDLNLTDTQTKQIQTTMEEFRGRMSELRTTVTKAESDFEAVMNEDSVDQAKANEAINRLASARGEYPCRRRRGEGAHDRLALLSGPRRP